MTEIVVAALLIAWLIVTALSQIPQFQARAPWNRLCPSWMLFVAPLAVFDIELETRTDGGAWRPVVPPHIRWWERPWGVTLRHRKVLTDLTHEIIKTRRLGRDAALASGAHAILLDMVRHRHPDAHQFRLRTLLEPWPPERSRVLFLSDPIPTESA
ncbi:MAG: hypothetical protein AAGD38_05825 [Acidobacteriota bacterium]